MNFDKYFELRVNSELKSRIYKILFFLMVAINFVLLVLNLYISQNEKTVLVPLSLPGPVVIHGNEADPEYLKSITYYVTSLLLNYNFENAREKFDVALKFFAESSKEKYKKVFASELENIKLGQITSYAEPADIYVDSKKGIIVFSVKRRLWSKGLEVEKDNTMWCYLQYKLDSGSFKILEFSVCKSVRCEQELGIRK